VEESTGWDIPRRSLGDLLKMTLHRKPGRPTFSEEGRELESRLKPFFRLKVSVHPSNVLGPPFSQHWQCHVEPTATGFSVRYRVGSREREHILVIAPQDKQLRKRVEGLILAWWQDLLPSDVLVPVKRKRMG
jgi:hypothetical protein